MHIILRHHKQIEKESKSIYTLTVSFTLNSPPQPIPHNTIYCFDSLLVSTSPSTRVRSQCFPFLLTFETEHLPEHRGNTPEGRSMVNYCVYRDSELSVARTEC